ncbi:MFS transporter [Paenibacillus radicis (ex Xue et al. 2023)]|uniref:MFS transporter n=1 Tax=Paenibacillus radicis (ex Xue et al. 2023) TaxID=2972489 RepID=A0ABT1YQW3_9BACL|nr:MFS transporter [Paenibacillus radicis (ex Xue et al. 2023)]MCR8635574.1 MFS transporter [Paenibacillus radicis (ex Xue et al. 2023)]
MNTHEPSSRLWTKPFISLTICSFLLFLNLQMLLSSFPAYVKDKFLVGDLTVSLVTSVFAISAIATRFLTAALIRRMQRKVILFIGIAVAGIITAIYGWADSIGSLLAMRVAYGIGFGMSSTIIPTLVSPIIPSKRMGEGIGYFGLSTSLAMSVGPMIGLNMMNHYGFGTLAVTGAATVLLIFPIIWLSRSVPPEPVIGRSTSAVAANPSSSSGLLFPALLNVFLSVTYSGLLSFIALFGESVNLGQVGLFFLFNVITIIIIRPISGKIFDKKGHAAVLIPAAICVLASMVLLSYTASMPMLIVSALLYGLGFGSIQPTIQAWMLRSTPQAQHGTANSMFYNSTDFGVAIGALILGAISSLTGYAVMYRYSAGFMLLFLIVYVFYWIAKGRKTRNGLKPQSAAK